MIPKNTTPIKNEILTEIIFKGKLNLVEIKIIAYIIRWSWGFDGMERRQDWTKKLTKRQIAKEGGMKESLVNKNINKMIAEKKIFVKNNCYQFNEHYEEWKNLTNSYTKNNKKNLTNSYTNLTNSYTNLTNSYTKLNKKLSSAGLKPLQDKPLPDRKETLKYTLKENIKKRGDIFINTWKEFKEMRKVKGKKMSIGSEKRILKNLDKLSNNIEEQIAILDQSIKYSWTGVFPLKKDKKDDDDHMPDLDELTKDKKYRDYFNMPDLDKLKKEGKI